MTLRDRTYKLIANDGFKHNRVVQHVNAIYPAVVVEVDEVGRNELAERFRLWNQVSDIIRNDKNELREIDKICIAIDWQKVLRECVLTLSVEVSDSKSAAAIITISHPSLNAVLDSCANGYRFTTFVRLDEDRVVPFSKSDLYPHMITDNLESVLNDAVSRSIKHSEPVHKLDFGNGGYQDPKDPYIYMEDINNISYEVVELPSALAEELYRAAGYTSEGEIRGNFQAGYGISTDDPMASVEEHQIMIYDLENRIGFRAWVNTYQSTVPINFEVFETSTEIESKIVPLTLAQSKAIAEALKVSMQTLETCFIDVDNRYGGQAVRFVRDPMYKPLIAKDEIPVLTYASQQDQTIIRSSGFNFSI